MAEQIIQMLNQLGRHYVVLRWKDSGKVYRIVHLEDNHIESCVIRWWYFDDNQKVSQTNHKVAPNAELDLLAVYADDFECYGTDSWYQVEWH